MFQTREEGWVGDRRRNRAPEPSPDRVWELRPHLVWEAVWWGWLDVGDERRVPDVLIVTDDMHSILPRLRGPVPHVTGAVAFVITFNLGLRGPLDGEAWREVGRVRDHKAQPGLSGRSPMFPSAPSPVTPMSPLYAYPDSLPSLTIFPSPSLAISPLSHTSCHPATYPESPLLCRWLPPRSQLTCPLGQSPTLDPMPALSGLQPLGSPGPQKD